MIPNEFLSSYPAKLMEYSLAAGYLGLFVPFWRYVQSGRRAPSAVAIGAPAKQAAPHANAGWFHVPADVLLHPGHTWARVSGGEVAVGVDDFAARLLGKVASLRTPEVGESVLQGSSAVTAEDDSRVVTLVSPIDGTVTAVNAAATEGDNWLHQPYGAGWLFKVKPSRLGLNTKRLLGGDLARRWVEQASESLAQRLSPQLGAVLQDGGTPVHGIARELEPERWDELCRDYFHS